MGGVLSMEAPQNHGCFNTKMVQLWMLWGISLGHLLASSGRQDIEGLEPAVLRSLGQGAAQKPRSPGLP